MGPNVYGVRSVTTRPACPCACVKAVILVYPCIVCDAGHACLGARMFGYRCCRVAVVALHRCSYSQQRGRLQPVSPWLLTGTLMLMYPAAPPGLLCRALPSAKAARQDGLFTSEKHTPSLMCRLLQTSHALMGKPCPNHKWLNAACHVRPCQLGYRALGLPFV